MQPRRPLRRRGERLERCNSKFRPTPTPGFQSPSLQCPCTFPLPHTVLTPRPNPLPNQARRPWSWQSSQPRYAGRDATNRGRVPTQTLGEEWNHSDARHGGKARPKQTKGMTSGSWYQPAPAKGTPVSNSNGQGYRPL
ncbi:hypothetical protein FA13DRAFT_1487183 [Coprinellus micaceus]|uniref:Uncharacterized protein n=1 Tax=Coprinellus micaceus TaxID=71717 RepID=A0A4Y7TKQ6_COPMI|nr:hypothetical protein FA13DRAFT_1487183 [Coprinellus micaceus]